MIFKTNVTKEDFKRAYTSCLKEAWIFHNEANFLSAVEWNKQHLFTYNVKSDVDEETGFESDASSINIFEAFEEAFANDNPEKLAEWKKAWTNDNGFERVDYAGDAISDGDLTGDLARQYFVYQLEQNNLQQKTNKQAISLEPYSFNDALERTQNILTTNLNARYLFEAAFSYDNLNLKTRCDILEILDDGHVNLYEVKATSSIKDEHFYDVAYQVYVLEKNGLKVDNVYLVNLNPEYIYGLNYEVDIRKAANEVYQKYEALTYQEVINDIELNNLLEPFTNEPVEDLDLKKVFNINDYWAGSKKMYFIDAYRLLDKTVGLEHMFHELANYFSWTGDQALSLMKQKSCITPLTLKNTKKEQGFLYKNGIDELWCYHVLPWYDETKESVLNLPGTSTFNNRVKASIFYKTGKFYFDDINSLESLDLTTKKGEPLFKPEHIRIFNAVKKSLKGDLQPEDILDVEHLDVLKGVLQEYENAKKIYMYDFETAKWAIPKFWYSKTYQQIPFQYSIDVIEDEHYDYNNPQTMKHHDFLSSLLTDPRPEFIVHFLKDILISHGPGIYVAYNKSFEQTVLKYLAYQFPKYAKPLIYIAAHTIDLMDFFKGKKGNDFVEERPWFLVYHPNFHGSYSIKKTQPALDPSFNYDDLTINKGDKASQTFREYIDHKINDEQWSMISPNMIIYCNRDTLAMVVILKQVETLLKKYELEKKHE